MKIKLLDLFCKAGGCSVGYDLAAKELGLKIEITGIDIEPQPNYPFTFVEGDALDYLKSNHQQFTHIHASPPCQKYSQSSAPQRATRTVYSDMLEAVVPEMYKTGKPGVIENVMPAPIRGDIVLRGNMFGLKTLRKRKFETVNWFMLQPGMQFIKPGAVVHRGEYITCAGSGAKGSMNKKKEYTKFIHGKGGSIKEMWSEAMGIDWMTTRELREAIPPAYCHYIGMEFLRRK